MPAPTLLYFSRKQLKRKTRTENEKSVNYRNYRTGRLLSGRVPAGKGYEVHGLIRRSSISNTGRIDHLIREDKIVLHGGDMTDSTSLVRIIGEVRPDEIYNLGAQSHVQVSFEAPEYAGDVDALGVLRILEAVRMVGLAETCRIYQASTSELYGRVEEVPQNENTPFHPYSPYAVAKQYGFWIVKEYREAYNMFAVNGILFNHESERRGETFVTRKITLAAGRIACGIQDKLYLGNLDSKRDWGYAKDYVECMWLMLQHDKPEDFVIATGVQHTVREFTTLAFHYVGIELEWQGSGIHEKESTRPTARWWWRSARPFTVPRMWSICGEIRRRPARCWDGIPREPATRNCAV